MYADINNMATVANRRTSCLDIVLHRKEKGKRIRNNWEWKERGKAGQQQAHLEIIGRTEGLAKRESVNEEGKCEKPKITGVKANV